MLKLNTCGCLRGHRGFKQDSKWNNKISRRALHIILRVIIVGNSVTTVSLIAVKET